MQLKAAGQIELKGGGDLDAVLAVRAVTAWCDAGGGETAYVVADEPYGRLK